jgi:hypothetical protein
MTKPALPKTVECRGCNAVIYFQNPRKQARYEVRVYEVGGRQQRPAFATYDAANDLAEATVREIAKNR